MRITLSMRGLFVVLRYGGDNRDAIGFVIKPRAAMIFSERNDGYRRSFSLGPLYVRTFARKALAERSALR